jgi:acetolactate synthase I/II/III large subunit
MPHATESAGHVGQQLVNRLIDYGVTRVFGCPGGQTLPLYNGIAHRQDKIQHVLMHDERSGVYAADAYARATGTIGVCDATVGPGASNLVSGLVEASSSSVPLLAIVSDIPIAWEHRRAHGSASQAFEQRSFLESCVKYYGRVGSTGSLPEMLHACIRLATSGRPGPTVLEVPDDIFAELAEEADFPASREYGVYPRLRSAPDPSDISRAVAMLQQAQRPIIVVGGGALRADAGPEILDLAQVLGCPIATTLTGKGVVAETHPMAVSVVGRFGVPMANSAMEEADCVIFIGSKTGQTTTLNWTLPFLDTPVIHIDIDPGEIGRSYHDSVALLSDAKLGAAALAEALRASAPSTDWNREAIRQMQEDWWTGPIAFKEAPVEGVLKPQDVMRTLRRVMSDDDLIVSDASLASGWIGGRFMLRKAGRRFFAPRGLAGLGWGLPAAVGVSEAMASGGIPADGRVVCVAGDGGWGYSLAEVETALRRRLPIVSVILNNSTLGWIKHSAAARYPDAMVSQDFERVSYAHSAEGLGANVATVTELDQLELALKTALSDQSRVPWVIEATTCKIETPVLPSRVSTSSKGGY